MIDDPRVNLDFNSIRLLNFTVFKILFVLPIQLLYRLRSNLRIGVFPIWLIRNPKFFKKFDQHRLMWFQHRLGCKVCNPQLLNYSKQINFLVQFICRSFKKLAVEFVLFCAATTAQNKTPKVFWLVHEVLSHLKLIDQEIISLIGISIWIGCV